MTKVLTHEHIRKLLRNFSAAIQLDQRSVDALPPAQFHPQYNDEMWRAWRIDHVSYIKRLLSTVEAIPSALLVELTTMATTYDTMVVRREALELFADAVSGSCPEELTTAENFLGWLIKGVRRRRSRRRRSASAKSAMAKWLARNDPLRIAEDPECQYILRKAS
ncbi:hypothetical protein [Bradyrhizobium sp. MOS003]|uniref:hypothetical protein n=1 Tax=Bradyrhizobium sp. MOS003 TaxID=2133946 RepID=UPI000D12830A|nr:hypothetical protein [Bradyrhizobium sp. MOS003]PSO15030.1 hypothetical protein C7G42_29490 [Bradyrhizobium sp. MOS003]